MRIQSEIERKLQETFTPVHLEVINESHNHNVPKGSESHFKVLMVADIFEGKMPVVRQRLVNKTLADELAGPVHALSMKLMSTGQWEAAGNHIASQSPPCVHKS